MAAGGSPARVEVYRELADEALRIAGIRHDLEPAAVALRAPRIAAQSDGLGDAIAIEIDRRNPLPIPVNGGAKQPLALD